MTHGFDHFLLSGSLWRNWRRYWLTGRSALPRGGHETLTAKLSPIIVTSGLQVSDGENQHKSVQNVWILKSKASLSCFVGRKDQQKKYYTLPSIIQYQVGGLICTEARSVFWFTSFLELACFRSEAVIRLEIFRILLLEKQWKLIVDNRFCQSIWLYNNLKLSAIHSCSQVGSWFSSYHEFKCPALYAREAKFLPPNNHIPLKLWWRIVYVDVH